MALSTARPDVAEPRIRRLVLAATAAAVLLAGMLGWVFGGVLHDSGSTPPKAADRITPVGDLRVLVDGSWTPVAPQKALAATPGLEDLTVFAPIAGLPGQAWLARAALDGPSLLPAGVRARVDKLPAPEKVRLAGHLAWRYPAMKLADGSLLEVTTLPTTHGVLLVGCEASPTAWSGVAGCAADVHGLGDAATLAPTSTLAFHSQLGGVVDKLNARRTVAGRAFRRAGRARGQQAAARKLAAAHATAATALAPLAPATGPERQVVKRLSSSAKAYGVLARAAGARNRRAYGRARSGVRRADKALQAALAGAAR